MPLRSPVQSESVVFPAAAWTSKQHRLVDTTGWYVFLFGLAVYDRVHQGSLGWDKSQQEQVASVGALHGLCSWYANGNWRAKRCRRIAFHVFDAPWTQAAGAEVMLLWCPAAAAAVAC